MRKIVVAKFVKIPFYFAVIFFSWTIALYLRSDVEAPRAAPTSVDWEKAKSNSRWIPKSEKGINHIFLSGNAFERGLAWGSLTGDLLEKQEQVLVDMYSELMPSKFKRKLFEIGAIAAFQGLEATLDPWTLEEMWGVSQSASDKFNFLASPYARQIAYHGIHEVGQLFVDLAPLEGACTFVSYPIDNQWIVGRTFDFEGGRIFDEEKVIKWVYPDNGLKYVSVIWTGMVGAVSGVNEKGIYVSVNAAGSKDVNLRGMPSTLLITKVLQEANDLDEALKILRDTPSMITDIYMVLDSQTGRLFKVEKSAFNLDISEIKSATAVTNHLTAEIFKDDEFNKIRRDEFTSTFRFKRAQSLLDELKSKKPTSHDSVTKSLLSILRDKGLDDKGSELHLGNRRAIDALIAAHGVLFDSKTQTFYVSEGPSMVGAFRAYDLRASFKEESPIEKAKLPSDPKVSIEMYADFKEKLLKLKEIFNLLHEQKCQEAYDEVAKLDFIHVEHAYASTLAASCLGKTDEAKAYAAKGMALSPPHKSLENYFESVLEETK